MEKPRAFPHNGRERLLETRRRHTRGRGGRRRGTLIINTLLFGLYSISAEYNTEPSPWQARRRKHRFLP